MPDGSRWLLMCALVLALPCDLDRAVTRKIHYTVALQEAHSLLFPSRRPQNISIYRPYRDTSLRKAPQILFAPFKNAFKNLIVN